MTVFFKLFKFILERLGNKNEINVTSFERKGHEKLKSVFRILIS